MDLDDVDNSINRNRDQMVNSSLQDRHHDLEELIKTKLYLPDEIKIIIEKRQWHRSNISGTSKTLQQYLAYIAHEKALLRQVKIRREASLITEGKDAIELKIFDRIAQLYTWALSKFATDLPLNMSYIAFCEQFKDKDVAIDAVHQMVKTCGRENPKVFVLAAQWYINSRSNRLEAIVTLDWGLSLHKTDKALYREVLNLAIPHNERDRKMPVPEDLEIHNRIKLYVESICAHIQDVEFLIEILNILETHNSTSIVQEILINTMLLKYSDNALLWNALSQREKRNLQNTDLKASFDACIERYEEGLKRVSDKTLLYSMYLHFLMEVQQEKTELSKDVKYNLLKKVFLRASNENSLTEQLCLEFLNHCPTPAEVASHLAIATKKYPQSLRLWELYLKNATNIAIHNKVDSIFRRGVDALKENSLTLFLVVLKYYKLFDKTHKIQSIYTTGLQQPPQVSQHLKVRYLEWFAFGNAIDDVRKIYDELAWGKPYSKDLHLVMNKIESLQIKPHYVRWNVVHENACAQFGKDNIDVWLNLAAFYVFFDKDQVSQMDQVRARALRELDPFLHFDFLRKYIQVANKEPPNNLF